MTPLSVHVLGTGAARPYSGVFTSAVYLVCGQSSVLIDCGEGILTRLPPKALSQRGLDAVCITHLHGDHVYGLPGLLTSMSLAGRRRRVRLIGPTGLSGFVAAVLDASSAHLTFEVDYLPCPQQASTSPLLRLPDLTIASLPLRHRIEAHGFCVSTTEIGRRIRPDVVRDLGIPYERIPHLRNGEDLHLGGVVLANADLTLPPHPTRSVGYLTDTEPLDAWPESWPAPDLLFHDATFLDRDVALARKSGHSTFGEAAAFAKTCNARSLLLTHTSVRYADTELEEGLAAIKGQYGQPVKQRNPEVRLATQGETIEL